MIDSMNEYIRSAFRKRMRELDLTQAELGDALGTPQSSVSRILTGKSGRIPELVGRIAEHLGLELTAVQKGNSGGS